MRRVVVGVGVTMIDLTGDDAGSILTIVLNKLERGEEDTDC
jgi:hypothetical protein